MAVATISSKYQIVIPKEIRQALDLQVGQKVTASVQQGKVLLEPETSIKSLRGMCAGIDTHVPNDPENLHSADFT